LRFSAVMPRIALGVEYDGTDFVGWQIQRDGRSVEGTLAAAVQSVADEASMVVHGSGRTDAGVHASNQVAHFDTNARRTTRQWLLGINSLLPPDVAVRWVREVPDSFDARRSALRRRYRYEILQQPTRPALHRRTTWWIREPLDAAAMSCASLHWLGEHDFSAFRAAGCQAKSPMRRLMAVRIARIAAPDRVAWAFDFTANAFLQHMVRNLVGALVEIGRGDLPPASARDMLASRDRKQAAVAAPPSGLTLVEVLYPEHYELPTAEHWG
jgi:tRNA pseudouridine38-40 synthase